MECEWCVDEICTNDKCPLCCDFCPVQNEPGVCRFEERGEPEPMTGNEYQRLAARTISPGMGKADCVLHALSGMVSEMGELHGLYQKNYQGHGFNPDHAKKELGDLLWFIAEYCTAWGWELEDVMRTNIEKLKARYPEGFEEERSLHRAEGDI